MYTYYFATSLTNSPLDAILCKRPGSNQSSLRVLRGVSLTRPVFHGQQMGIGPGKSNTGFGVDTFCLALGTDLTALAPFAFCEVASAPSYIDASLQ